MNHEQTIAELIEENQYGMPPVLTGMDQETFMNTINGLMKASDPIISEAVNAMELPRKISEVKTLEGFNDLEHPKFPVSVFKSIAELVDKESHPLHIRMLLFLELYKMANVSLRQFTQSLVQSQVQTLAQQRIITPSKKLIVP